MLRISRKQFNLFDEKSTQKGLKVVAEIIKPRFKQLISASSDKSLLFEDWFHEQTERCYKWDIKKANNIKSYCEYAIEHYPNFPLDEKFDSLLNILRSTEQEDHKLNKINYRLLFLRD